jgi:hypothetical protein
VIIEDTYVNESGVKLPEVTNTQIMLPPAGGTGSSQVQFARAGDRAQ